MKQIRLLMLFALIATAFAVAQDSQPSTTPPADNPQATTVVVTPSAQPSPVRILTPTAGQTLTESYVHLHFELAQPSLSGEPNFLVQLDGADPINMTDTDYTFPDVQPGTHIIRVTLVDANKVPVQGGSATVQFKVPSEQPAKSDDPHGAMLRRAPTLTNQNIAGRTLAGTIPALPIPPELRNEGDPKLPLAGSPLPMLSLIGFGLLIGGAAQAMRMR
jgi:hypothetical protein